MSTHLYFKDIVKNCLVKIHYGNLDIKNKYIVALINDIEENGETYEYDSIKYKIYLKV